MKKIIVLLIALLAAFGANAGNKAGKQLAKVLESCMRLEDIHPDSLYSNIRMLEQRQRSCQDATERAVYDVVLGKLYADRSWRGQSWENAAPANPDSLQEWARSDYYAASLRHFNQAFAAADLLYAQKAMDWLPLTLAGNSTCTDDMLSAAWRTMRESTSGKYRIYSQLPGYRWMRDFYLRKGNREAALMMMVDSLSNASGALRYEGGRAVYRSEEIDGLIRDYGDLPLTAELYLMKAKDAYDIFEKRKILEEGLKKYPNYERKNALNNALTELYEPSLRWDMQKRVYPGRKYTMTFRNRNVQKAELELYQLSGTALNSAKAIRKDGKLLKKVTHVFPEHDPIETFYDTIVWNVPEQEGYYGIIVRPITKAKTKDKINRSSACIKVTKKMALVMELPKGEYRCEAVDAVTGAPLGCDCADVDVPSKRRWYSSRDTALHHEVRIFTDRQMYRPGQTLHVSGMTYNHQEWKYAVCGENAGFSYTLRDRNGRNVASGDGECDEYGAFGFDITLPEEVGLYTLSCGNDRITVNVEEYKRPTFEVVFDPIPEVHFPIDTLVLKGKARRYSGAPLREARVVGRYNWTPSRWCYFGERYSSVHELDTILTDAQGCFEIRVPVSGDVERFYYGMWLRAAVNVMAPDGESHDGATSLSLCSRKIRLYGDGEREVNRNKPGILVVEAYGSTEKEMTSPATLRLYKDKKQLHEEVITTGKPADLSFLKQYEPGRYNWNVEAICEGDTARWGHEFLLCDERVNAMPVDTVLWCYMADKTFAPGKTARVQLGTNQKDAYLYINGASNDQVVFDTIMCINEPTTLEFPYEERYGQSLTLGISMVRDERMYQYSSTILLEKPETKINYHWDTFRDHLKPGEEETWTLTLTNLDGTPAKASLMATLYDQSLDYFGYHNFAWTTYLSHYTNSQRWTTESAGSIGTSSNWDMRLKKTFDWEYWQVADKWFDPLLGKELKVSHKYKDGLFGAGAISSSARPMVMREFLDESAPVEDRNVQTKASVSRAENAEATAEGDEEAADEAAAGVAMRENFNETAFFFPSLITDEKGQVVMRFRLPESLTTWHFKGFAHTKDMRSVAMEEHAVANKELMAELRLPRFLRQGDKASLTATINNISDEDQACRATLTLLDGATEKVLLRKNVQVNVAKQGEEVFHFDYDVPGTAGSLICRWQVQSSTCSDGEQRLLPVLSDKEWVEYTEALWLEHTGKQSFDLRKKFAPAKGDSMQVTVEYTTHPIWIALETLPTMANPYNNDAISLASAYYAVSLTQWALRQIPELKGDPAFQDKTLGEQKCGQWLNRLSDLQNSDGSFSWYPGMSSSRYMTTEVALFLARLYSMTGNTDASNVLSGCIRYLKKTAEKGLGYNDLEQLYIDGLAGESLNKTERKWLSEVPDEVEDWSRDSRALAAIVLMKNGHERKAKKMFETIERYLVSTPALGTYIDYPEGSFTSIDMKIRRHTLMMEAVQTVTPKDTARLASMRRWLLQQKRTQGWKNAMQTADAVYALVSTSRSDIDDRQRDEVTLHCGNRIIKLEPNDSRRGYFRETFDVTGLPTTLNVNKRSKGESWGAVFVRSKQQLDDIQATSTGLRVKVDVIQHREVQDAKATMKRTDKLTLRYTITADRDYDYVCLSAERPACSEPMDPHTGHDWQDGLSYYREVRDSRSDYFFARLPRGTYVIEEDVYLERQGQYSAGIARIQCEYAKEFQGHSANRKLTVKE